jgi:hypothetical protein
MYSRIGTVAEFLRETYMANDTVIRRLSSRNRGMKNSLIAARSSIWGT